MCHAQTGQDSCWFGPGIRENKLLGEVRDLQTGVAPNGHRLAFCDQPLSRVAGLYLAPGLALPRSTSTATMLPYHHQYLPLNYDTYAYDIALPPPQPEQPPTHMFTDTPQTLIPTPSDLLHRHSLDKPKHPLPPTSDLDAALVNKTETQRKARQRAVAEEIGFVPTDPYVWTIPLPYRLVIKIHT